jgi:hypothetical protein
MRSPLPQWILFAALALALSACNTPGAPTQAPGELTPVVLPTNTQTPRPVPTDTATPQPGLVILVAPQGSDPAMADSTAAVVRELAAAEGMNFEQMTSLSTAPAMTRVVVYLNPGVEIKNLAGNTPDVQFVTIGALDLQPLDANLSQILVQPEQSAFLAGYIAALAAPDWRTGGLLLDTPNTLQQAFLNGGRYHCGRCVPRYAPIVLFPVAQALPAGSDAAAGWSAFKLLDEDLLEVVYVDPALSSPELLAQLAAEGIGLIGSRAPAEEIRGQWIASVYADSQSELRNRWPELLNGNGGFSVFAPLVIEDINPDRLSEARMRLVREAAEGLQNGSLLPVALPGN